MPALHQNLSAGRWHQMTLAEQLGNVGSEFERALKWQAKNQPNQLAGALARMFELLDLTISDPRWQNHRLKELTHLKANLRSVFSADPPSAAEIESLKKYLMQFALRARRMSIPEAGIS